MRSDSGVLLPGDDGQLGLRFVADEAPPRRPTAPSSACKANGSVTGIGPQAGIRHQVSASKGTLRLSEPAPADLG